MNSANIGQISRDKAHWCFNASIKLFEMSSVELQSSIFFGWMTNQWFNEPNFVSINNTSLKSRLQGNHSQD